jgi:hypothetical protein
MDSIGRERFASLGSDSTGNTKLARELAQIEVPTLLLVPDPDHHLSNTIKDICKIEYFVDVNIYTLLRSERADFPDSASAKRE